MAYGYRQVPLHGSAKKSHPYVCGIPQNQHSLLSAQALSPLSTPGSWCWLQLAFAAGKLVQGNWTGTLRWSQLAVVCSAVMPRQWTLFSSQEESGILYNVQCFTSYVFLPQWTHLIFLSTFLSLLGCSAAGAGVWGAPAPGEEVWWAVSTHLPKEGTGSGSPDIGTLLWFFIGSSVTTNSCGNCPLFPVRCFLNHWLCKTIAEVDSQKCSEALGVKYCDKRRHSSSLLHCTL